MVQVMRQTADFHPNIWGEYFFNYNFQEDEINCAQQLQEIEDLKEEVRKDLLPIVNQCTLSHKVNLIDSIRRLGVGYHFETEIKQLLQYIYDTNYHHHINEDVDPYHLYTITLCFRLLRQHGYYVSCGIFNNFKDEKGNFKESLASDVAGMLSLYEAAYLGAPGEDILDEAIDFTTTHLHAAMATGRLSNPLAAQVSHALYLPLHRRVPRVESRHYISIYQDVPSQNQALLKLAKLDFNLLQSLHKKELYEISKWWKNLDPTGKLAYARDRIVECYFWMLGLFYEPHYSFQRRMVTRGILLISNLDDTYDAYGTPEELNLFTEIIERWDVSAMNQLPEYMRVLFKKLLAVCEAAEEDLAIKGWSFRSHYVKEAFKFAVRSYFEESKWLHDNRIPTMDEYMKTALASAGYTPISFQAFVSIDSMVTKEALNFMLSRPPIMNAAELIARVMNDITSHKFERKRGHVASSVECYMKQYGVSKEEAYEQLLVPVNDSWKKLNGELLKLGADDHDVHLPKPMLTSVLNLTRTTHLIYDEDDLYTRVGKKMKACIASVLIDPIPI